MNRIDLKTGFSCNNHCVFCVQGDKRKRYKNRTTEELLVLLEEHRASADGVVLTGGEVTLRKDLPQLVEHASGLGYKVIQIQTNGRMFAYRSLVDAVVEAGVTEVSPAIHGPNAEIHDALVDAEGAFSQTVAGIRRLVSLGIPILMNSVITQANYRHLPAMARLFVDLGVRQFQLAFVHALGTAADNFDEVVPRYGDIRPYVKEALSIGIDAGLFVMTEAIPYCFMSGFEDYVAETLIPSTAVIDAEWVVEDYTQYRLTEGKAKGPQCQECIRNPQCEGPWREYPERFGWDEFQPVAGSQLNRG